MKKSVRIRSKDLMKEGFTNMQDSNFQQAVVEKNDDEIQSLIQMQKSFDSTINAWQNQKDRVVTDIKNKPQEYQDCVESCRKNKVDDALNACLFGCGIGKFASSSTTYRGNKPPPPPIDWAQLFSALETLAAAAAIFAAVCAAAACFASGVCEVAAGAAEVAGTIGETVAETVEMTEELEEGFALTEEQSALLAAVGVMSVYTGGVVTILSTAKPEDEQSQAMAQPEEKQLPAMKVVNATMKRLGSITKPETVDDVIAAMALMPYMKGNATGTKALFLAVKNLRNSKYAKYSGVDLTAADLQTFNLGKMNALQYYQKLIEQFGFTT